MFYALLIEFDQPGDELLHSLIKLHMFVFTQILIPILLFYQLMLSGKGQWVGRQV